MPILRCKMLVGKVPNPFGSAPFRCRLVFLSDDSEDFEVFVDSLKRCWDDNIHTTEEIRPDIVSLGIKALTANRKQQKYNYKQKQKNMPGLPEYIFEEGESL